MNVKIRIPKPLLPGIVETTRDPVHPDGGSKLIGLTEKWREIGIVEIPLADDAWNHGTRAAQFLDRVAQFFGGSFRLLQCDGSDGTYPAMGAAAFFGGIIVLGAAHRRGQVAVIE
jgi:hypothetical protein